MNRKQRQHQIAARIRFENLAAVLQADLDHMQAQGDPQLNHAIKRREIDVLHARRCAEALQFKISRGPRQLRLL